MSGIPVTVAERVAKDYEKEQVIRIPTNDGKTE